MGSAELGRRDLKSSIREPLGPVIRAWGEQHVMNPFTEKNNYVSAASCMRPQWTHADTLSFIWWKLKYLRPVIQFSLLLPHGDHFRERWRGDIKTFHVIVIAHLKQSLLILDPRPRVLSQQLRVTSRRSWRYFQLMIYHSTPYLLKNFRDFSRYLHIPYFKRLNGIYFIASCL